jgi:hypothetical protein
LPVVIFSPSFFDFYDQCFQLLANNFDQINQEIRPLVKKVTPHTKFFMRHSSIVASCYFFSKFF